jgi:hypothetical protein
MSLDLTPYTAIQSSFFVRIIRSLVGGGTEVINFSDYHRAITIDSVSYTGLGQMLAVTESQADLRITSSELTLSISGIPTDNLADLVNDDIRGSRVEVDRVLFNPTTGVQLDITGNPAGRFRGYVNTVGVSEDYDNNTRNSSLVINIVCTSSVGLLSNKLAGRATNPWEQKALYPGDLSFDRVPNIANANYNFGAP